MYSDKRKGFTLIELLAVLAIVFLLAAASVPAILKQRVKGMRKLAEANIAFLNNAIKKYVNDLSFYPATDGGTGCSNLIDALTNVEKYKDPANSNYDPSWHGPYISLMEKEISGGSYQDSWGNAYCYRINYSPDSLAEGVDVDGNGTAGQANDTNLARTLGLRYFIWSRGPNEDNFTDNGGGDDITSW